MTRSSFVLNRETRFIWQNSVIDANFINQVFLGMYDSVFHALWRTAVYQYNFGLLEKLNMT